MFCPQCGAGLIKIPVPAEKAIYDDCSWGDCVSVAMGTRYNKYSGMRQFAIRAKCPNKKWYNDCTDGIVKDSLHESDLPELLKL